MTFSQSAACNVVPLLARIVLAAAFIPAGWNKVMTEWTPPPAAAQRLQALGVLPMPVVGGGLTIIRASLQAEPTTQPDEAPSTEGVTETVETPPLPQPPATQPATAPASAVTVRALHQVTVLLDAAGFSQYAVLGAWAAALTELVGGALLLVGLFSRFWGLGLAVAMGMAFYLTSLEIVTDTWIFKATHEQGHQIFAQAGLFVLAFGVFLTGAGALSLDRAIFRSAPPEPLPPKKTDD
jgi:uncharacterized membrane protein YphA (DoxX/SURF4 family)